MELDPCKYPIPYEYTKYLFYSSFLIGATCLAPIYQGDHNSFMMMFLLFLTSICYWSNAEYGFRRNIDMLFCKIVNFYFYTSTLVYKDEYTLAIHTNGMYTICMLYFLEHLLFYFKNKKWIIFHMTIHINFLFIPFICYIL